MQGVSVGDLAKVRKDDLPKKESRLKFLRRRNDVTMLRKLIKNELQPAIEALEAVPSFETAEEVCLTSRRAFATFLPAFREGRLQKTDLYATFEDLLARGCRAVASLAAKQSDHILEQYANNIQRRMDALSALRRNDLKAFREILRSSLPESLD